MASKTARRSKSRKKVVTPAAPFSGHLTHSLMPVLRVYPGILQHIDYRITNRTGDGTTARKRALRDCQCTPNPDLLHNSLLVDNCTQSSRQPSSQKRSVLTCTH